MLRERFVAALGHQVDLFGVPAAHRTAVLRHTQWLDTGDPGARDGARAARAARGVLLGLALAFTLGWRRPWALTRPWRRVEASRADRAPVRVVPAVAVVLSRAVLTWFAALAHLVPVLVAWALFAVVLRSTTRGPTRSRVTAVVAAVGLAAWDDQSALLPWGLSRILGTTAHLEVPTGLPVAALLLGARRPSGATTARP
ncbi:hypothetical protein [Saccharothrix longispora]|uniref:hypothetical protein n=1 Tax=Saccharothrix longispora TaxID=33920 RepID=UPI0028FD6FF1|nr:hypothetical protein [Saccharothrix longispora]MBY8849085.1 hypothetical protein [Saccharothrix sp. MB29]MDU0288198.1 hypothetical protein [Saccharothrix longispora]